MKLMLASLDVGSFGTVKDIAHLSKYILLSYYYVRKQQNEKGLIDLMVQRNKEDNFILDSGAFTFFSSVNESKEIDFDGYLDEYIAFINKYNIKRFAELDVDSVAGYEKVLNMRNRLESETGKQCIPVWHVSRGIDDWKSLVKEYDYIAIGGIVSKEITKADFPKLKALTHYANVNGTDVHGLGFTNKDAYKYGFYSVDSSSWRSGSRYGAAVKFRNNRIQAIKKPENTRANYKIIDRNNFIEWCKFQRFVERY